MAFQAGYSYPVGNVLSNLYKFEPRGRPVQVTMDGNQALAYGLIAAGVRYGAAYPITHVHHHGDLALGVSKVQRSLRPVRG